MVISSPFPPLAIMVSFQPMRFSVHVLEYFFIAIKFHHNLSYSHVTVYAWYIVRSRKQAVLIVTNLIRKLVAIVQSSHVHFWRRQ